MDPIELNVELKVKSVVYEVNLNANDNNLVLEIQNSDSAERWKGTYDKKYVEDLTRKTGNFKSFPIFVNMLQTALNQESSTVTLDLLTFSDLENLRNKNSSILNNSNASSIVSRQSNQTKNCNKKYLIMTYNVEFDRINYPLQLRFQGKLDSVNLMEIIRNLKNEIKLLKSVSSSQEGDFEYNKKFKKLEKENHHLREENESLELEIIRLNNTNQSKTSGNIHTNETKTQKEINSLKKMIKKIEEDAIKEKNVFLKQIIKKNEEINQLKNQMNKMIENERNMINKLKAIKDFEQSRTSNLNSRSSSKESIIRIPTGHKSRLQSNSIDRFSKASSRFQSNSLDRLSRTSSRKVSISPASSTRLKRFDPTEYCKQKKSKIEERNSSKRREIKSRMDISSEEGSRVSNSERSKIKSNINRSKLVDSHDRMEHEYLNTSFALNLNNENTNHRKATKTLRSYNRDQEMKEIDDKLKSLHNLIKYSL